MPYERLVVMTPSDLEIVMTRSFSAARELVFEALTRCEHLQRWYGRRGDTITVCEIDLRVGGAWRIVWRLREGIDMGAGGEYREIVAPERIVQTEAFEGDEFEAMGAGTLNTLRLEEREGGTLLTVTTLYKSREARDSALATGMEEGATETFERLAELLAGEAGMG